MFCEYSLNFTPLSKFYANTHQNIACTANMSNVFIRCRPFPCEIVFIWEIFQDN